MASPKSNPQKEAEIAELLKANVPRRKITAEKHCGNTLVNKIKKRLGETAGETTGETDQKRGSDGALTNKAKERKGETTGETTGETAIQRDKLLRFLIQQFIDLELEIDFPDDLEQLITTIIEQEMLTWAN